MGYDDVISSLASKEIKKLPKPTIFWCLNNFEERGVLIWIVDEGVR